MASGSHKYSANEALAFILASDSDSNDSFGDESSLDSSDSHDSKEERCFRGTEVDEIYRNRPPHTNVTSSRGHVSHNLATA